MAVKMRLKRMGKKRNPIYRIVVADARSPRDGRNIDEIGLYDPNQEPCVVNIDEEAATGTASGALSSYLFKYKVLKDKTYNRLAFEQGYYMNSPSRIIASLHVTDDEITGVYVGGNAIVTGEIDIKRGI